MKQYAYFNELPLGTEFHLNGNRYIKKSSKTGFLTEYSRIFYFKQKELVIVGLHSRLGE